MQEPDDDADVPTVTLTDVLSGTVRERASDARRPSQQLRHLFKADAQQDELAACARYVRRCLGHPVLPTWPEAAAREALMRAVAEELGVEEAAPLYPHPGDAASLRGALADVEAQLASCRTARRVAADEASGPTEREAALAARLQPLRAALDRLERERNPPPPPPPAPLDEGSTSLTEVSLSSPRFQRAAEPSASGGVKLRERVSSFERMRKGAAAFKVRAPAAAEPSAPAAAAAEPSGGVKLKERVSSFERMRKGAAALTPRKTAAPAAAEPSAPPAAAEPSGGGGAQTA